MNDIANPFASDNPNAPAVGAGALSMQSREVSEVQGAMIIAKRFPRDPMDATDKILQDCTRPSLAEAATYDYSRGGTSIIGASVRLAEAIAQRWGNIATGVKILASYNDHSECLAYAVDLESGYREERFFQVKHWRDTKKGGYNLTDERDIYELSANMGARRKRACMLAVIPGEVVEVALKQCELTLKTKAEITPERLTTLIEKFAEYQVTKEMLEKRIQRRLDAMTPALMMQLGKIYNSLKDGMSKASDWFEIDPESAAESDATKPGGNVAEALKERIRAKKNPARQAEAGPKEKPQEQQDAESSEGLSFAMVAERMRKAEDLTLLAVAEDFIPGVPDLGQQAELREIGDARRAELTR